MKIEENLRKKGWSEEEIQKATNTMNNHKKTPFVATMDKIAYWIALFILIFGNFLISVILIPFLILTKGFFLYLMIFVMAFIFGLLYNILIKDMEKLDSDHKIMAGLFIPALAIINIYIMVGVSNHLIKVLSLSNYNNPFVVSAVYVISFVLPFLFSEVRERLR